MTGSSKILTVSYGTFSCTLEGFDNPFGTMQGIAEYFRDLAAEDRYFGAEPPQPDAQMLHQIAEREVRRRVEARVEDSGVVLRQMDNEASETAEEAPTPAPLTSDAPATGGESVAEKLARIRGVVAKARAERERSYAEDEPVVDADDESLLSAFASAEDAETSAEDDSDAYTAEAKVDDESEPLVTAADALDEDEADISDPSDHGKDDAAEQELATTREEDDVTVQEEAPDEMLARLLDGDDTPDAIAADVPENDAGQDQSDDAFDTTDKSDDIATPAAALVVGAVAAPVAAGLTIDAAERSENTPEIATIDLEETDLRLADDADQDADTGAEGADAYHAETADEPIEGANEEDRVTDTSDEPTDADDAVILAALAEAEAPVSDPSEAKAEAEAEAEAAEIEAEVETPEADDDHIELEMEDEDGNPTLVRLTRAEFEQMLASGEIEEIDEETDSAAEEETVAAEANDTEDSIRDILAETGLSADDRDALAADLAALEDDGAEKQAQADADDMPEAAAEKPEATTEAEVCDDDATESADTARPAAAGDSDLDRLIDEANTQLDEPEGNRRRSAIQHLKRAVAATKADSGLRDRSNEMGASIAKFRDDLRQVVRPRRPEAGSRNGRTGRPTESLGSGPLVLVSSQRVDQTETPVRPVKPTRPAAVASVETSNEHAANDAQSFSEFAERRGARELPDLLEAAAAYAMIVEGQEGVSRPQLLRRAASVAGEGNMTREEGLKSFGQLLRSGRLRKLSAGRFALAEDAQDRDSAAS